MSLSGKVVQVHDDLVEVLVVPRPECQGCKTCQSLLNEEHTRERVIQAFRGDFPVVPGDQVTLDLLPGMGSLVAVILFAVPLIGFFAGVWAGPQLGVWLGYAGGESAAFLCGILGFFLAMGLIGLAHRLGRFQRLQLRIVAKTT